MTRTQRIDAAHAAAVLSANGSILPPGITDAAGYAALLHPDLETANDWRLAFTQTFGTTLIGLDVIEGGVLALYQLDPREIVHLGPPEET